MSSPKGRTLLPRAARARHQIYASRHGTCAWCGEPCSGPATTQTRPTRCPRCGSAEIDWDEPAPAEPHTHVRNDHTPGSVALSLLGAVIRGR